LGLLALGIGLHLPAHRVDRGPTDPDLPGYFGCGLAFGHPPHQQHCLRRPKGPPFKNGPAVEIVNALALVAAVHRQAAALGLPKFSGLLDPSSAMGTLQPRWVKVLEQPLATEFIIK